MFSNYIEFAIKQAKLAKYKNKINVPIGCVIVNNNTIISSANNSCTSDKNQLKHAEIKAIDKASRILNSGILNTCELYTTLEPCLMCYGSIINSRIKKLFIGSLNTKFSITEEIQEMFRNKKINHFPEIIFLENKECSDILSNFFKKIRKWKKFSTY